ncbi:MAG: hypothetical protein KJZ69_11470 [Phycisphaerales bacterium]|nr:hypothetical protein [Phycisphaerales bacterium]
MNESRAIVNRSTRAPGERGEDGRSLTLSRPRWLFRRLDAATPPLALGRLGTYLREVCAEDESAAALARLARIATEIRAGHDGESFSIGVTSAARRGNRQSYTAVTLAGLWARWEYSTILIEVGGRSSETGRRIRRTVPCIADVLTAIECGQHLPMPQPMTGAAPNLDALAGLGRFSLPRLADGGLLAELSAALCERYQRIIWSLPSVGPQWSVSMLAGVLDRLVISVARGRTDRATVERLAADAAAAGLPPLQLIWHQ